MAKKRLSNEVVDERLAGRPIQRVGDYSGSMTKIDWKCTVCDHKWEAIPSSIFAGTGCPACGGNLKLTHEIIDERIIDRPIKRLGDYVSAQTKIEWGCKTCGHEWKTTPTHIFSGTGCPACSVNEKLSNEIIDERIKDRPVERVGDYINTKIKIKWKCTVKDCGHEWEAVPNSIFLGNGCPACGGNAKLSNEIVDERIKDRPIKRLGDYVGAFTKILWSCTDCNHKWEANPMDIMVGNGCPACAIYGFDPAAPAILYLIKVGDLYKVGITNRTIEDRYAMEGVEYDIIEEIYFDIGSEAMEFETDLKQDYADYLYDGPPIFRNTMNTEIFTINILEAAR